MQEFRGNTVLTFDKETKGAIVLERMDELGSSIRRWLEKNMEYIEFVVPIEDALVNDPVQAMFCGTMARMSRALRALEGAGMDGTVTVLRTEYPERDLSMIDVLNARMFEGTCAGAVGCASRVTGAKRSWPSVTTTMTLRCLSLRAIRLSWGMRARSCAAGGGR